MIASRAVPHRLKPVAFPFLVAIWEHILAQTVIDIEWEVYRIKPILYSALL